MKKIGWLMVASLSMAGASAQTWQVCTWDARLESDSRLWEPKDWVEQTRFDRGEVAAMEVSVRQTWEVQATILNTNGPYTEPCAYANGRTLRMVLWPSLEHQANLPNVAHTLPKGSVITMTQMVTVQDVQQQQLSSDEFELITVLP